MVDSVKKNWKGLNVNLSTLVNEVVQFFESKEFNDVTVLQTEKGYEIVAGDSKQYKMENDVSVAIEGEPDDFSVSLAGCTEQRKLSLPLMLTSMFGGGYFLLKNFRSEEAMQKLERDFGKRIGTMIERTTEPLSKEEKQQ